MQMEKEASVFWQSRGQDLRSLSLQESKTGHVYEKVRSLTSQYLVRARVPVPCVWVAAHVRFIKVSPGFLESAKKQVEHSKAVGIRRWYSPTASWNKGLHDNTYIHILRHSGIDNQTHKSTHTKEWIHTHLWEHKHTHTHEQDPWKTSDLACEAASMVCCRELVCWCFNVSNTFNYGCSDCV